MNIALVHDFLVKLGGAERVLKVLGDIFPKAPIYTLLYDEEKVGSVFPRERIRTSDLQKFPCFLKNRQRYLLPFFPREMEKFDLSAYDLVISSNSAFAHGIITASHVKHICYCHSPMRYAWDWYHEYKREQNVGAIRGAAISFIMHRIRMWDQIAKDRPDLYIANSKNVQRRIQKYYRMDSKVIYPPVDIGRFNIHEDHEDYFLIVSTLTPYKKIDLAIRLFNKLGKHLIIVGDGSQKAYLKQIAEKNIEFTGFKSDAVVQEYLEHCRALIFPGEEDFGITPVEAMACGKPVLALGRGGVKESVIPGKCGEFFEEPTEESMEEGLLQLLAREYDPHEIRRQAEKFSRERFEREIRDFMNF